MYGQPAYGQQGYGQPPAYGQPAGWGQPGYGYGYPVAPQSQRNTLSLVSLITGITGFIPFLGLPLSICAIVCGFIARSQVKRTGQDGKGFGLAGIILGFFWIAAYVVVIVLVAAFGNNSNGTTCTYFGTGANPCDTN